MRMRVMLAGIAAAGLTAFPALAAQDAAAPAAAPADGQFGEPLGRILAEAAGGTCLEGLMAPALLAACNGQIAGMAAALGQLGEIEAMTFVSADETPGGRVETWRVRYAGGQTLNWFIGLRQTDGRFEAVGTAG